MAGKTPAKYATGKRRTPFGKKFTNRNYSRNWFGTIAGAPQGLQESELQTKDHMSPWLRKVLADEFNLQATRDGFMNAAGVNYHPINYASPKLLNKLALVARDGT